MPPSSAAYLTHADLANPGVAEGQRLLDPSTEQTVAISDAPVRQGDRRGCESAEHIDDRHRASVRVAPSRKALDRDFHRGWTLADTRSA
jgi:hypothetical protein